MVFHITGNNIITQLLEHFNWNGAIFLYQDDGKYFQDFVTTANIDGTLGEYNQSVLWSNTGSVIDAALAQKQPVNMFECNISSGCPWGLEKHIDQGAHSLDQIVLEPHGEGLWSVVKDGEIVEGLQYVPFGDMLYEEKDTPLGVTPSTLLNYSLEKDESVDHWIQRGSFYEKHAIMDDDIHNFASVTAALTSVVGDKVTILSMPVEIGNILQFNVEVDPYEVEDNSIHYAIDLVAQGNYVLTESMPTGLVIAVGENKFSGALVKNGITHAFTEEEAHSFAQNNQILDGLEFVAPPFEELYRIHDKEQWELMLSQVQEDMNN